jgi:HKD family nuclease
VQNRSTEANMATFDVISNSGGQNLLGVLKSCFDLSSVQSVRGAVSFLMNSGTKELDAAFRGLVDSGVPVTIVFGDDFHLTQSGALSALMATGCELRLYGAETHSGYHPKLWIIDNGDERAVIVGSSNLSHGGLRSNAEANVLIRGSAKELEAFDEQWTMFASESKKFTADDLKSYVDAEAAAAVPPPKSGGGSNSESDGQLRRHIERWQRYIAEPHVIEQLQKWRGWYLVPEHGQLADTKLVELQQILEALNELPQYQKDGLVSLGNSDAGVANAVAVLTAARVTTSHTFSDQQRRNLFVRQQCLYLRTFGWLEQIDQDRFRITSAGELLGAAGTEEERTELLTEALSTKKWIFGGLAFYPFFRELLQLVPEQRLYYDELNLIVIHCYHHAELGGIANLVAAYRGFPDTERESLRRWADERLRGLLAIHAGETAYGRYRKKVADLLVAFGNTIGLEYVDAAQQDLSYVRLV